MQTKEMQTKVILAEDERAEEIQAEETQAEEMHRMQRSGPGGKLRTGQLVTAGMMAAVIAVLSQISIPMPTNVPLTLSTFVIALTGTVLSYRLGLVSLAVYILAGIAGAPVFTGFRAGIGVLAGYTGGFIWGFPALVLLCGIGAAGKNRFTAAGLGMAGLFCCHFLGVLQYALLTGNSFTASFLLVSAPYLLKDILSVAAAFLLGKTIRRRLKRAGITL